MIFQGIKNGRPVFDMPKDAPVAPKELIADMNAGRVKMNDDGSITYQGKNYKKGDSL